MLQVFSGIAPVKQFEINKGNILLGSVHPSSNKPNRRNYQTFNLMHKLCLAEKINVQR